MSAVVAARISSMMASRSGTAATVAATKASISDTLLLTSRSEKRDKVSVIHKVVLGIYEMLYENASVDF